MIQEHSLEREARKSLHRILPRVEETLKLNYYRLKAIGLKVE